jgi:hypothetical protein
MKRLAMLLLGLTVHGCGALSIIPPQQHDIERSRGYPMSFDKTWSRAVDWFADHNVEIDKIEKTSGLLTAKYQLGTSDTFLDCGDIRAQAITHLVSQRSSALNVTVRPVAEQSTTVNVNFFGTVQLQGRDFWDGGEWTNEGYCASTGELEKTILDFIGR